MVLGNAISLHPMVRMAQPVQSVGLASKAEKTP
jgi:hypothetical protein